MVVFVVASRPPARPVAALRPRWEWWTSLASLLVHIAFAGILCVGLHVAMLHSLGIVLPVGTVPSLLECLPAWLGLALLARAGLHLRGLVRHRALAWLPAVLAALGLLPVVSLSSPR